MGRFADMFIDPDADPRADPPARADERATIAAFLRWQRDTLELKCSGLDAADLARRPVAPSTRPHCRCSGWCATWPRWSAAGSGG